MYTRRSMFCYYKHSRELVVILDIIIVVVAAAAVSV